MASNKDSFGRTLFVVVGLCLICSVLVSTAAVVLKPIQQENKLLDKQKYILEAASLINTKEGKVTKKEILSKYEQYVEARLVDLKTGEFVEGNANLYDQRKASRDTDTSSVPENDIASIKRVADTAVVYLVHNDEGKLTSVILPIHGYGLWSTMYALLALEADLNTVQGLVYYDQGETPGLGGEVENPKWKALWKGKQLFDAQGNLAISVTKNPVVASSVHGVDALSGATLTSNGVQHSLQFWLGKEGFANFIAKAHNGGLS
ncbi:Na(+)-translocating NADH-quinone reductase subunit C [Shewanella sp. SR43-4]|uniref:Na(+)-translocating NADH-quinone reductase subunit C n=1 Tax=Shewanella vesiculosa TaxID=518738 RepID=A0ABV0FKG4_9GAMM|nr:MULTISPECIES: Na(+)-translocating NADH-quinone reductase subunit C [Shewanella]NCQ46342.1 Na(+)-translocating NADH-quinone reductase subunit C [Shewanella frigidimarina]MBB1317934.1 Na(+)-translocating NADH-quinone reductase subunit C [Shewanella sp. SR43-4]MBB1320392.1 Na(+)-translocating NADH-quinone reductase subunit C [Shewanella sp. SR43-8]MBB1388675.1 Na(+)-translocating NADH-quinone reductase subunit C [Shewanella sp. SG44-6]MBB1474838.1 Na(+)-translocating NADH-quinone reductase sub